MKHGDTLTINMRKEAFIWLTGIFLTVSGSLLWYTAHSLHHQAIGAVLLTIGVPISVNIRNPSIHRYGGIIFLTWSALCMPAISSGAAFGGIGTILFTVGTMLSIDPSEGMRNGVGIVLITWGALFKYDPGQLLSVDPGAGLAMDLGSFVIAVGVLLCAAAKHSDRRAMATGYWTLMTLRWVDYNFATSWWKFAGWIMFLDEAFPRHIRKIIRLGGLPIQATLLPIVFLYEFAFNHGDEVVDGQNSAFSDEDDDYNVDQFPMLFRFGSFLARAARRIDRFLYPESSVHQMQKSYERTLGPLRRLGCLVLYGFIWIATILVDIFWTQLFLETIPNLYTWSNSFAYGTIDDTRPTIRLLYLAPGTDKDALRGYMTEENVHNAKFEALSYAWGGHYTLRWRINIDGHTFWIADSVARALRSLRSSKETRALWIDQICIDQRNKEEKSDQVGNKMRLVFENAQKVVIWLGRPTLRLADAFEDLEVTLDAQAMEERLREIDRTPVWSSIAKFKTTWKTILRRKWWSRVWVVQEALLNENTVIRCGQHELSWESLRDFSTVPEELCQVEPATRELLSFSRDFKAGKTADMDIVDLSIRFRKSNASNTHDRIYAFYGLSLESSLPAPQVDYSRSIVWVFADYTAHYIQRTQSLSILALAETHGLSFPSWTVNFNFHAIWGPLFMFVDHWEASQLRPDKAISEISALYSACGTRSARSVQYDPEHRTLTLDGWFVDTVKDVACHVRDSRFFSSIRAWEDFARSYSIDWSKEKVEFVRTLLGDIDFDDLEDDWYDRVFHQQYKQSTDHKYARPPTEYGGVVLNVCTNRRLFVTERGSLGIGPAETEPGDYVCVLEGGRVPYILRPRGDEEKEASIDWQLTPDFRHPCDFIGESVLRGVMYATQQSLSIDEEAGRIQPRKISLK